MKPITWPMLCCCVLAVVPLLPAQDTDERDEPQDPVEQEGQQDKEKSPFRSGTFKGLKFRNIGPAHTSGRIGDFAVDPRNHSHYYVAVSSGGVWETHNAGTTWKPIFDSQGSYSIGCLALDPNDPDVLWVGTGENNSQRSGSYGDGIYKSVDGGRTFKKVGLGDSEHIGKILIDPRDSDTVYVAAQGPLWGPGGDRGLYKTTDGGETWNKVLDISENTGVSDLTMDPRDPDVLLAAAYQRRRHVWTLINGGPESGIHKSTDGGATWRKVSKGLPSGDLGRIGMALAPTRPDTVYAIVEASQDKGGFYRSTDGGENWSRMSDHVSSSPQYYQELVADPVNPDKVYSLSTRMQVTEDGGKTFRPVPGDSKHVDDHALWIDPDDTRHLLCGCDGGIYESFDGGQAWRFIPNLPVTQFYKIAADNTFPFYFVYGGTQDNFTLGGPSRTTSASGIVSADWFVTQGGDGFESAIDPENPDIVYSQSQHGGLVRFDRASGERMDIQPQVGPEHEPLRWNWSSPLVVSRHLPTRLYFAANYVFRSDDRGDSWQEISPNLTRQLDRDRLEVMDRIWEVDAVSKNRSTSAYGSVVAFSESPLDEDRLYAGTDDGLIQATTDGGRTWSATETFADVPDMSYVSSLEASRHDPQTVYAALDNHKRGDFKPYVLKSVDGGATWFSVAGDLPERGSVHAVIEDHVDPDLLFVGTEFGVFFTIDGGTKWLKLSSGMPTIAARDLDIQAREDDLVVASFGRGFYILDDYSPLRDVDPEALEQDALLFPVKRTWQFIERTPLGGRGKGMLGASFFTAPNPPNGAVFTWYLKESPKTLEQERHAAEAKARKEGETAPYPTWDELRAEDRDKSAAIVIEIRDAEGVVVRRLTAPTSAGINRTSWDLHHASTNPVSVAGGGNRRGGGARGPLVPPGRYSVTLNMLDEGRLTRLAGPQEFEIVPLAGATLPAASRRELADFHRKTARLQGAVLGASRAAGEAQTRIDHLRRAIQEAPAADAALLQGLEGLDTRLKDLLVTLQGDTTRTSRYEPTNPSIMSRVGRITSGWRSTSEPTQTQRREFETAAALFEPFLDALQQLIETDLARLEKALDAADGPWTPGRVPRWRQE